MVVYFTPNYETVYLTPRTFQNRSNYPTYGFRTMIYYSNIGFLFCLFPFLFISVESLKNHSKSQKNHKMKNLILLDFTWVDLHSEHIIWYALVQSFFCSFTANKSRASSVMKYELALNILFHTLTEVREKLSLN
jgi:hypothetical protein